MKFAYVRIHVVYGVEQAESVIRILIPAPQESGMLIQHISLYTILTSPILYGVWHRKEGSVGGRILRSGRAIVLQ